MRPSSLTLHLPAIVPMAHRILREALQPGDCALDATAGNGHDTLLLAECVGPTGRVWGFDVQAQALAHTRQRLSDAGVLDRVTLVHAGHETLAAHVDAPLQAAVFNLGWLPGSDKQVVTRPEPTCAALEAAADLLQVHGVLVLVVYQGHPGAVEEREAVEAWASQRDPGQWRVARYALVNVPHDPPYVLACERVA